ncbi:hypothetical protein EKPJFOCH_3899 [Methylobacterium thuringiense]|uniref:DUF768 domain-containing protein n=2 Tax=Methylobacterium thuringiense TaxID=1003091 RepID=A0ABQ4TPU7_9HYPH|nr:hypothetical protein EKPJFOCH_3899 [Methylobacterium thuringiense]
MSDRPSSFVRDWISENIRNDPTFEGDVDARTAKTIEELKNEARKAGLDMTDPELDDDLLWDEVHAAIEMTHDPMAGGIKD